MFSGIGGFELGIQQSDINTELVGYAEIDKYAISIFEKQFTGVTNYGDATTIEPWRIPDFDLLVGGFPCQAFSIAGKQQGFSDTRGTLFFDIARICAEKRPRYLVLENVKGLLSHDNGQTFQTILRVLADLGYRVEWQVLNSKNFGVPQNRERVFIVGHPGGGSSRKIFPLTGANPESSLITGENISYALDANYYKGTNTLSKSRRQLHMDQSRIRRLTPTECERLQGFPDGWTKGLSDTQRYKTLGNAVTTTVVKEIFNKLQPSVLNDYFGSC